MNVIISNKAEEYLTQAYWYDYFENMENKIQFTENELKQNQTYKGFENFSIPKHKAYKELYKFIEENPDFIFLKSTTYEDAYYIE